MAVSGLLSLKWNNHSKTFLKVISCLQTKSSFTDATIACDGKLFPVHKFVLSICSEYFEDILDTISDKYPVIFLKDISGDVLEALLKYMYVGEVNVEQDKLSKFISAAECLKIKGLAVPDEDPVLNYKTIKKSASTGEKRRYRESVGDDGEFMPLSKIHKSQYSNNECSNVSRNYDRYPRNDSVLPKQNLKENRSSGSCHNGGEQSMPSVAQINKSRTIESQRSELQDGSSNIVIKKETNEILIDDEQENSEEHCYESTRSSKSATVYPTLKSLSCVASHENSQASSLSKLGGGTRVSSSDTHNSDDSASKQEQDMHGWMSPEVTPHPRVSAKTDDHELLNDSKDELDNCDELWLSESDVDTSQSQQQLEYLLQRRHSSDDLQYNNYSSEYQNAVPNFANKSIFENLNTSNSTNLITKTVSNCKSNSTPEYYDVGSPVVTSGPKSSVPYEQRQFPCTFCNYRATVKCNLMMHLRKHTGEKPYSCSVCGFTTAFQQSLQRHFKNAHKERAVFENSHDGGVVAMGTNLTCDVTRANNFVYETANSHTNMTNDSSSDKSIIGTLVDSNQSDNHSIKNRSNSVESLNFLTGSSNNIRRFNSDTATKANSNAVPDKSNAIDNMINDVYNKETAPINNENVSSELPNTQTES